MRTETANRLIASGTNALASSIMLACRPRPSDASATTRRAFVAALKSELPLRTLIQGSIGALERGGIFEAKGGKARLLAPAQLEGAWDAAADDRVSVWEATVRLAAVMAKDGADKVAELLASVQTRVNLIAEDDRAGTNPGEAPHPTRALLALADPDRRVGGLRPPARHRLGRLGSANPHSLLGG